ncbi:hypothetical protein ACFPDQ_06815 [Pseudofrancisella aestuarii]|uniref:Uncharacterized protein n=1 Tax=Pseudofrancisella aestuarii TaxID=2670347 RepID=A0ABV9TC73_9GAMM|nr:hypothetical protein [Pseudofrancisella aestuarii]
MKKIISLILVSSFLVMPVYSVALASVSSFKPSSAGFRHVSQGIDSFGQDPYIDNQIDSMQIR